MSGDRILCLTCARSPKLDAKVITDELGRPIFAEVEAVYCPVDSPGQEEPGKHPPRTTCCKYLSPEEAEEIQRYDQDMAEAEAEAQAMYEAEMEAYEAEMAEYEGGYS